VISVVTKMIAIEAVVILVVIGMIAIE